MGQIVNRGNVKAVVNLQAIQTVAQNSNLTQDGSKASTVLANGEIWLIDTTNSKSGNGDGKYDSYIVGNGNSVASALTIQEINEKIIVDNSVTQGSTNAVSGGAVYSAIQAIDVSSQISGKADKSEMSIVPGTGANADKTTITLKSGTSATVLTQHQDISGKQDELVIGTNLDNIPTTNSSNPITSGAIAEALEGKVDINKAVLLEEQILSSEQRTQARSNIGAASSSDTYTKTEVNNLIVPVNTAIVPVESTDWPLSSGNTNTIYRVAGTTSYTDYAWDGTQFITLATYDNPGTVYGSRTYKTTLKEEYWLCAKSSNAAFGTVSYIASGGYAVPDYIDVYGASKISFVAVKGSGNASIKTLGGYVLYDANKEPILGQVTITGSSYTTGVIEVVIPSDAYYIRYTTDFGTEGADEYTIWKQYPVSTGVNIVDNLEDGGSESALSAEQGKLLGLRAAIDTVEIDTPVLKTATYIDANIENATFGEEGSTSATDNCCVTDFIECDKYKRISFYGLRNSSIAANASRYKGGFVFYDANKNAIQDGACITQNGLSSWSAMKFELDVPSNAAYFRYTIYPSEAEVKVTLREPNKNIVYKTEVVNNLEDGGVTVPLSAEQGKVLLGLSSYTDERDTSVFTKEEQDPAAITITKVGDEWVINKPGSTEYRGVGLFIGTIPTTKEYTWVIEYSSTSTKATNVSFSTLVNRQQATHTVVGAFAKNASHAILTFSTTREADKNYLTVSSADMSNVSTITLHSIRVYNRMSVQELGAVIEEGGNGGGGSSSTDYANVVSLFAEKKALADSMKHGDTNFSCLLFSDLHGDTTNLSRIMDLYDNWEDYFTCGINVGDTIYDTINTGTAWYWTIVGDREFLFALGNHDVWGSDGGYNNAVEQAEYDAWIAPLVNKTTGLVQPSNADSALLPYYYKDYGNIRVIVLSTYTNRLSSDLAWFTSVLSDAITNSKKVIVVNHIAHSLSARYATNIQHNVAAEGDYNNGFKSYLKGGSQQGYVDAPSGDTDNVGNGFVVAVKTFMDNGGTFITWINGHMHRDFFTDLSGTSHETTCGKQAFITLSTARADYQNDNPKTWPDGTGMDSFYMFSVDEDLGVFKLMKFGAETDYAMRPRKFLAYSYVDHKIVAQS